MTADDLRALSAAATPGPWYQTGKSGSLLSEATKAPVNPSYGGRAADGELVVWLRNHAGALADLIDFVQTVERPGCNNHPSCIEQPPRSGLMCLPCSATQALAALDADR